MASTVSSMSVRIAWVVRNGEASGSEKNNSFPPTAMTITAATAKSQRTLFEEFFFMLNPLADSYLLRTLAHPARRADPRRNGPLTKI